MSPRRPHLLSELVPAWAERDAHASAVGSGDESIDAEELAIAVGRLSAALRDRGIAPGDRVAVFAPKSIDSFVAVHAALHAGAIAVPIGTKSVGPTLEAAVDDIAPAAVVVGPATAARWPSRPDVLAVGQPLPGRDRHLGWDEVLATEPRGPVARTGDDPAYIITTSGSTGRPKGIVHTHASGLRYAELAADCYDLGPDDRMANVAPFHFDQSTFELYAGPLAGASVVLVPEPLLNFPADLAQLAARERVTTWYSVPTILRGLLERGALETCDLRSLRWVLFGGEVFPLEPLRELMTRLPGARFSNVYGPAEVNQCTFHHLDRPPTDEPLPIGRAWPDTEIRLVDDHGNVLSGPAEGELEVRTTTAMAGYWARPDLTASAFRTASGPGGLNEQWYRTGDLVTRDRDGLHRFLGRRDRQVKVRGVRVELEAVESALGSLPGVTGSAAVTVDADDGALVGLIESTSIDDPDDVRRALRGVLSPDATPDRVVVVDALPRTTSGKVDVRRAAELVEEVAPT